MYNDRQKQGVGSRIQIAEDWLEKECWAMDIVQKNGILTTRVSVEEWS